MKKTALAIASAAMTFTGLGLAVPANAGPPPWAPAHGYRAKGGDGIAYRYAQDNRNLAYWQGQDGRYYCKRSNGTVGLLAGGALGALLGRAIDTRGERATGTILGAAAGALLGREVQQGRSRCR